jgi:hypothetical protein
MKSATKKKTRRLFTHLQLNTMPLHELLAIALRDLRKQETTKGCTVDMDYWLIGTSRKCKAFLAGCVMRHSTPNPEYGITFEERWMTALDYLRHGNVGYALAARDHRQRFQVHALDRPCPPYESGVRFRKAMRQLHADLKKAGL